MSRRFFYRNFASLFYFGFFVHYVLADFRVKLAHLYFFRMQALVLGRGVKMASAS